MDINGGSSCNEGNVGCDFHRNLQYDNSTEFNGGFDDYVETTVHPGSSLFIATLSFCIASTALLPFFVAIGNKRSKLRKARKLKQNQDCGKQEEDDAIQEVKIEGSGATATTTPIQEIKIEVPSATETTTATPWSSCGNCMVLDCTVGNLGFEEDDNLSFFENIEKHLVDDDISLTQDNAITADGEIATNFCCLGSEVKSDSIPINELACNPDEDSKVISTKSSQKKSRKSDIFQKKRKRSGQPGTMERQLSIMTSDSSISDSSSRKARQNKKKSRRKKIKKVIKSITKVSPLTIHKNVTHTEQKKIPSTRILDGGFYGPRKNRRHLIFSESQMMREEKRDLAGEARKRKKLGVKANHSKASRYEPPPLKSISFSVMRDTITEGEQINSGLGGMLRTDWYDNFDEDSVGDISNFSEYSASNPAHSSAENLTKMEGIYVSELCCGTRAIYQHASIKEAWKNVSRILRLDNESRRILSLMAPFAFTSILVKIFDAIDIALISSILGTDALAAYSIAGYFVGLTYETLKGFTDALCTLSSHAVGAENYHLAGQYIQLSQIIFLAIGIPFVVIWGIFTYDVMTLLDMSSSVAEMGQQWATIAVLASVANGLNESLFQFSSVIDSDNYTNIIAVMMSAAQTAYIALTLFYDENASLVDVGWVRLNIVLAFIIINISLIAWRGWLDLCWDGMVKTNALKNRVAVRQMLKTGIPLSLGAIVRESQWGALLLFSSKMGPAEVATWTILRTFWDTFAASMEGICCAAEIRCAYHIGKGRMTMAKISSYKSLAMGTIFGAFWTFVFYVLGEDKMPKWFTHDETLQNMMLNLVPLACLSNITMAIGMVCWSLIGAQGRYRLATSITFLSGWFVTVPIGAVFVYGYNFDLQGLVAAVTIGYSVSSTVLLYLLIRSNWEKRVHKVQKTICEADSLSSDIDEQSSIDFSNNEKFIVGIQDVNLGKLESDTQITANVRMRSFSEVMDLVDQLEDTDLVDQLEEAIRQSKSLREDT